MKKLPEQLFDHSYILHLVLIFILGSLNSASYAQQYFTEKKEYVNPVLNEVFADPSVIRAPDGWYYAYATRTWHQEREMINIQIAKSRDLVHWNYLPDGMPVKPSWADSTNQFWAPDIQYDPADKTFYLYFASAHNGTTKHCIGVATSKSPEGPFKDMGHPLVCGVSYTHIDPMVFLDKQRSKRYILWGSDHAPIQIQELSGWTELAPGSTPQNLVIPTDKENNYDNMIEGPWLIFTEGYYYLFFSGDNCCGVHAHYGVMVARSKNVLGPYEKFRGVDGSGNGVILEQNSHWWAPGHNAVIATNGGKEFWLLYHAIDPEKPFQDKESPVGMTFDNRVLLLDRIFFKDGWPRIENNSPSFTAKPAPLVTDDR